MKKPKEICFWEGVDNLTDFAKGYVDAYRKWENYHSETVHKKDKRIRVLEGWKKVAQEQLGKMEKEAKKHEKAVRNVNARIRKYII